MICEHREEIEHNRCRPAGADIRRPALPSTTATADELCENKTAAERWDPRRTGRQRVVCDRSKRKGGRGRRVRTRQTREDLDPSRRPVAVVGPPPARTDDGGCRSPEAAKTGGVIRYAVEQRRIKKRPAAAATRPAESRRVAATTTAPVPAAAASASPDIGAAIATLRKP